MMKRIIALLLALILTVGLLPTVALATEGNPTTDGGSTGTISGGTVQVAGDPKQSVEHEAADDPIHIKKSVSKGTDGKDYLTMEAYVTNPLEIKQEAVPLDIVLVLDVSGSMDETFKSSTVAKYGTYYKWTTNEQYAKYDNLYYGTGTPKSKVSVTTEAVYTPVDNLTYDDIYEDADRSGRTSYYAKDSNGTYHRLGLDWEYKGWARNYYITVDGQREAQINDWDAQVRLNGYESLYQYETKYTYKNADTGDVILTSVGADSRPQLNGTTAEFYYYNGDGQQKEEKIDALKAAVKSFIDNVNKQELPKGKAHRISIVTFASNAETKAGLTAVNDTNAATLKNAVDKLRAKGATQADKGMSEAAGILTGRDAAGKTRPSVVIMFTDGMPTSSNGFEDGVAAGAINNANGLKKGGTTVYTIAVADGADPKETPRGSTINENINWYLNAVSSNYPNASATETGSRWNKTWTFNYGTRVSSEKDYYFTATDAQGLSMVFDTISREVSNLALIVDSNAVLSDTLSGFFTFDGVGAATKTGITVKEVPVKGTDANGNFTWDTDKATNISGNVDIAVSGKSITVKGFDYGEKAVTKHQDGKVTGSKLVITFPIKPDDNATWEEGRHAYPTNDTTTSPAGLTKYALKSAPDAKDQDTLLTQSPTLAIEAHKVTYVVEANGYTGTYTTPPEKVYRTGAEYTIADPLTPEKDSGYTFNGWYDNADCTGDKVTGDTITGNVTLYGKFTKSVFTVDFSEYVKKHLELTGVETLPGAEAFTVTGKEYKLVNGNKEYTGKDFAGATNAILNTASGDVAFTGAGMSLNLSAGEHTFEVKETVPTDDKKTPGMNYSTTEYTLKISIGSDGNVTVVEPSTKVITVTNTYAPEAATLDLTGKFKKVLTSNTLALPTGANSFELTIKNGTTEVAKGTATVALGTTPDATGKFTGEANFTFINGNLTFTSAGTYNYKVTETDSDIAGMKYASEADLTILVENDPSTGKLKVTSATINGVDIAAATGTNTAAINNTFTAAELPLDPTPDPEDSSVYTRVPIAKAMTGEVTKEDLTFTAEIYNDANVKVTQGTAKVEKATTAANFSGFGALTFNTTGDHTFTIKEASITPAISGMTYDVGFANGHTMIVNVDENTTTNELYVKSVTIDGKTVYTHGETEATPTWLTITNNYVEPKNAQVTNKEVVVTQPEGALKTAVDAFKYDNSLTVLYPTGDGVTSNTLEVTYGTTEATLLYKITVFAGTETYYEFDDVGAELVYAEHANVVQENNTFKVTFEDGAEYAYVYVAVTHAISYDADGEYKARNFIGSQGAETTVTEKDPNKLTINFADFVKKELTATGSKTANDVKFRVIVNGMESPYMMYNVGEEEVSTYAAFDPKYSTVLNVNFASITGGNTETEWFIADNSIVIDQAGIYYFELNEEDGKRTGVTYDDSIYKVYVYVKREGDKLVVGSFDIYKDGLSVAGETITFHNTIDTGKDDYYPIIIPTIINKDTGMLNKTDHFAYVIGYPDGTVHPNGQITRAEVATIFFRLLRDEVRDGAFTTSNTYSDVAYGKWYNNPISTMSALGIITGYPDGTFKPNKPITRAEFAAIAARFDETQSGKSATFSDVIGHWAAKEIGIAYANEWIKGYPDGTFKPDQNITRAEAMTMINRVLERKPESPADLLTNMNKWTDNMDTSKWYYLDVQEATNSHAYTRKTFNYELWRQMLPDPDWSRYER